MAKYELKIYKENDEIEKEYGTDNVKWGFYLEAAKVSDEMQDMTKTEQFEVINAFVKRLFLGLTDEELDRASGDDVINVFNQLMRKARSIAGSGGAKNPQAAAK